MADYKDIIGLDIEAKSSNPTDTVTGEIWFNTSTGKLSYKKPDGAATWTTSNDLNVGRRLAGECGTQTAALCISGLFNYTEKTEVESYNGSSWTEIADINDGRYSIAGFGTTTAAIAGGGFGDGPAATMKYCESWNGSSWTEVNDSNNIDKYRKAVGISTAGLMHSGPSTENACETWNGHHGQKLMI